MIDTLFNNQDGDAVFYDRMYSWRDLEHLGPEVNRGDVVAVILPRSALYVAILLKCLRVNAVFCPLDPGAPRARIGLLLTRLRPSMVVRENEVSRLDDSRIIAGAGYIIHTSGSSGAPKAVVMESAPLLRVSLHQGEQLSPRRYAWLLNPGFDASLADILGALLCGATLYIPKSRPCQLRTLSAYFHTHQIDTSDIPPSLLRLMARERFPTLSSVVSGGEPLADSTVRTWGDVLHVAYGPTEAAVCASMHNPPVPSGDALLGDWVPGVSGMVLIDGHLCMPSAGAPPGELWLYGDNLAVGYLDDRDMTKSKFPTVDGTQYFRTGDSVAMKDGKLCFLGRIDRQIKVNGALVCPEEIEAAAHTVISGECAVAVRGERLVLFTTTKNTLSKVRFSLAQKLPSYMLPAVVVVLAEMPRLASGKINYQELRCNDH